MSDPHTINERPKTRNRLLLYIGISITSTLLAGLTLAMFGDGTATWAEFRFMWTILLIKILADGMITARAFIDRTPSEESAEVNAPIAQTHPLRPQPEPPRRPIP